jgi:hypothetical protein
MPTLYYYTVEWKDYDCKDGEFKTLNDVLDDFAIDEKHLLWYAVHGNNRDYYAPGIETWIHEFHETWEDKLGLEVEYRIDTFPRRSIMTAAIKFFWKHCPDLGHYTDEHEDNFIITNTDYRQFCKDNGLSLVEANFSRDASPERK